MNMAELAVEIPKELEEKMPEIEGLVREFIRLKVFELELKRSRELQRFVLDALASKSKLTAKGAAELGAKVGQGMLKELEELRQ